MGKTVAICQFGGELVPSNDGSMSYTGGEAHAIQVNPNMKLDEFKSEIAEMWHRDASSLSIKYFLPSNRRTAITVSNDKDMQRMIDFHEDSSTIEVFVLEGQSVPQKTEKTVNNRASKTAGRPTSKPTSRPTKKTAATDSITPTPSTIGNDRTISTKVPIPTTVGNHSITTVPTTVGNHSITTVPNTVGDHSITTVPNTVGDHSITTVPTTIGNHSVTTVPTTIGNDTTSVLDPSIPIAVTIATAGGDMTPSRTMIRTLFAEPITPLASATTVIVNDKRPGLSLTDNLITEVGQEFSNVNDFREALRRYAITKGFRCVYIRNEKKRVTAKCKAEGCPWRVHASRLSTLQKFKVKKINDVHTCGCMVTRDSHRRVTRSWVASIVKEKVRDRPQYKPMEIVDDIYREYGVILKYHQARRGKETALAQLQNSRTEAYNRLPWFSGRIRETNPGSLVTLTTTDDLRFHRIFVSFHASQHGFKNGCRPLILLDGTSLRDKCIGTLLAAVSVDGDDCFFPIAFAIVDSESYSNWHWFLTELESAVSTDRTITFVSDRRNGLENAVPQVFKDSYHAYSLHHLMEDFMQMLKGPSQMVKDALVDEFKRAAYTCGINNFNACIESMRNVSHDVASWVLESKPEHWSNAFFRGSRYEHVSSNVAGLFYGWITEEHELTIIQTIDMIRCKMMEMIYTRREASVAWSTVLTPSMEQRLQLEMYNSRPLSVLFSSGSVFEVRDDSVNIVDIETWDCTCRRWKMCGLPCIHAAAVIDRTGRNMYEYCSRYFTVDCYRLAYSDSIHPIPDIVKPMSEDSNNQMIVLPPRIYRPRPPPRWPRKKRKEAFGKKRKMFRCSTCGGTGHNKATCREPE